jgi:AcrR family transcriptional regulator
MSSVQRTPRRRPTAEVRRLMLDAAKELFESGGYEATKTKDIADRAGVSERLLFTNFGSKAGLFNAAFVEPLSELIAEYVDAWDEHPEDSTPEHRIRRLIVGMYDFAREHRTALRMALSGPNGSDFSSSEDLADLIARTLHASLKLRAISEFESLDATTLLIDVAGMAFGVALLDDMLIPRGTRRPSRDRLLGEMITTVMHGITDRLV